jgi:hypothetical protein
MDNRSVHMNHDMSNKQPHMSGKHSPRGKKLKMGILSVVIVLVLAGVVVAGLLFLKSKTSILNSSQYQAVFLTSGQVYFGKLQNTSGDYLKLDDVFYIQANADDADAIQNASDSDETDLQLIKLGNEIHGPEDEMLINSDQVLFFENLKSDGRISETIQEYYDQQDN